MRTLQDFASPAERDLFQDASNLPEFFQNNLVDAARVVKVFHYDPQATIRVFYYQYLKLCFELQNVDYELFTRKIEEILNNKDFKFVFYEDDDSEIYNDIQFKRLIMEFFQILGHGQMVIQDALNQYSIMDSVFIYFFRSLLILTGKTQALDSHIDRFTLLEFLGGYFQVEISVHDKCIKFVETDIFVYEQNPNEVFMAYMDYENEPYQNNPLQKTVKQNFIASQAEKLLNTVQLSTPSSIVSSLVSQNEPFFQRGKTEINRSYIASQFVDYTTPNAFMNLSKKNNQRLNDGVQSSQNFGNIMADQSIPLVKSIQENNFGKLPTNLENIKISVSSNQIVSSQNKEFSARNYDPSYYIQDKAVKNILNEQADENHSAIKRQQEPVQIMGLNFKVDTNNNGYKYKSISFTPYESFSSKQQSKNENQRQLSNSTSEMDLKAPLNTKKPGQYEPLIKQLVPQFPQQYKPQPLQSKNPFGLNVTKQFTNSLVMESMRQPYKSSVRGIRQRARNYRNSLFSYIQ